MSPSSTDTAKLLRRAAVAAISVAVTLVVVKAVAWVMTGSAALLSSVADSLMDVLASGLNLLAVRTSLRPPDREHRFGHGKAEPLAGLGQSAFVLGASVVVAINGLEHLVSQEPVTKSTLGVGVMIFATLLTGALVLYQRYVIQRSESVAIAADSLHYTADLLLNLAVIASLLLSDQGWVWVDAVAGVAIAGYMALTAFHIGRQSLEMLMDAELPDEERQRILTVARAQPEVLDVHDLRTRRSGRQRFIQLHLELDGKLSLSVAHAVGDRVEAALLKAFPSSEILVHTDPAGEDEPEDRFDD